MILIRKKCNNYQKCLNEPRKIKNRGGGEHPKNIAEKKFFKISKSFPKSQKNTHSDSDQSIVTQF